MAETSERDVFMRPAARLIEAVLQFPRPPSHDPCPGRARQWCGLNNRPQRHAIRGAQRPSARGLIGKPADQDGFAPSVAASPPRLPGPYKILKEPGVARRCTGARSRCTACPGPPAEMARLRT